MDLSSYHAARQMEALDNRLSSPTCEDLGIGQNSGALTSGLTHLPAHILAQQGALQDDSGIHNSTNMKNPFSPYSQIPLPTPYGGFDYGNFEPAFIRKRNERERERVRCVNEGYARLRERLPMNSKEKRISKVETLRAAIRYIQHLQSVLAAEKKTNRRYDDATGVRPEREDDRSSEGSPPMKRKALQRKREN